MSETLAESLRKRTEAAEERAVLKAQREAEVRREVRDSFDSVFKRDYEPLLHAAADEGKTETTLWIDPETDTDDPDIRGVRGQTLIEEVTRYLRGQGVRVTDTGTDDCSHSRSTEIGLRVEW